MKKVIQTDKAPAAIGPYSQAVCSENMLFVSGQLAIDPSTGKLIDGDISDHTRKILGNIEEIVKKAGGSLENIIKTTIFLTDLSQFVEVNEAYGAFFTDNPPARSTVQVAALPLGAPIEIESIAVLKK